ncbi:efflux transporter outer membrane subunit [Laribacter hongkongensis]|uniref:efflux transporter outer membrane subunit n=3 Tax=Laribacter hongkongensis TaxID=168471 RepID=UPI001EFE681E|nr:efflux transporter outer membrane subunit [Laribacter hongkongensis]MCG8991422.1 efflux transporter outer membrane subunit [Laribacter hongkongensis]MCG8997317.1 efflux transporter outer membrane subunit [Laribacter hongkongensis]MCG9000586.1 efflux transporter outer membrane subunit [Laribacter hongkongensis]MCG9003224.1 efflux transporter outer membrane subunit [Laribacter hongkongensis]MCG9007051.1 efflux transporter outer membrane subunit [Laribacter hongkongensis]
MKAVLTTTCLALLLAGCAVGPDYRRPAVDVPSGFRFQQLDASDAALDTEWWKDFGDPVLDGYVSEALEHNRNLAIAVANVDAAAAQLTIARASLFPTLDYQASASRGRSSSQQLLPGSQAGNSFELLGSTSWQIDLWGALRRQTESAQALLKASEQARRGVRLSVVSSTVQGYLQLRGLDQQLAIARRTANSYADTVKLFELQYQYGAIARITLEQVRSQYQSALASIPPIEASIVQTENALSLLLGRNPGPVVRGKPLAELRLPPVPGALPSSLLTRRPDILEAEARLVSANAKIGVARAQYFPQLTLNAGIGSLATRTGSLLTAGAGIWSVAGALAGSVFSGGATVGAVRSAEASTRAAEQTYLQTIQQAFADVENALSGWQTSSQRLKSLEDLQASSREYADLAMLQYQGGIANYLTVLDARRQLYSAEIDAASARTGYLSNAVAVYLALGGDWGTATQPQPRPIP